MRILNFGSLNIDKVYAVPHLARPGETLSSSSLSTFAGGKGLNQSVALAKAGAKVFHAGQIGSDGQMLVDVLRRAGADVSLVRRDEETETGHAVIQVDESGQNSIVLFGGANRTISEAFVDNVLAGFAPGDYLLLQNEISCLRYILDKAHEKGMIIALNPAPMDESVKASDLSKVSLLIVNELEGGELSGQTEPDAICDSLLKRLPGCKVALTLGERGAMYADADIRVKQAVFQGPVVDTTAAGDTFIGYFLAAALEGRTPAHALKFANMASGIAVGRKGASASIPERPEVEAALLRLS